MTIWPLDHFFMIRLTIPHNIEYYDNKKHTIQKDQSLCKTKPFSQIKRKTMKRNMEIQKNLQGKDSRRNQHYFYSTEKTKSCLNCALCFCTSERKHCRWRKWRALRSKVKEFFVVSRTPMKAPSHLLQLERKWRNIILFNLHSNDAYINTIHKLVWDYYNVGSVRIVEYV